MTEDKPRRGDDDRAAVPAPLAGKIRLVAPVVADGDEGGDPVCWAHLVCDECGAITTEGHRAGCQAAGNG